MLRDDGDLAVGFTFLVGGLVAMFYFPINIGNLIIPVDELIFFRGVAQPPTRFGSIPTVFGMIPSSLYELPTKLLEDYKLVSHR